MIIVCKPSREYSNYYDLEEFKNIEEAIEFIKENCYDDLQYYKMYQARELQLTLELKEVQND